MPSHSLKSSMLPRFMTLLLAGVLANDAMAIQVFVRLPSGQNIALEVEPNDTVENVKAKVFDQTGFAEALQKLTYADVELPSNTTLVENNVQKDTTIFLSLELPEYVQDSLQVQSNVVATQINTAALVLHGNHGHPLNLRALADNDNCFWAAGDWGGSNLGGSGDSIGLAEVGGCKVLNDSRTQLGFALGKSWSDDRTSFNGKQSSDGQYLVAELLTPLQSLKPNLWMTLTGYYSDVDVDIVRGYSDGITVDTSKGDTDATTWALRARLDWENALQTQNINITPYVDLSWLETQVDAYTESTGSLPAEFAKARHDVTELRLGLNAQRAMSPTWLLMAGAEAVHRFGGASPDLSGVIGGVPFAAEGSSDKDWWLHASVGSAMNFSSHRISMNLNASTDGPDPEIWLALAWSVTF